MKLKTKLDFMTICAFLVIVLISILGFIYTSQIYWALFLLGAGFFVFSYKKTKTAFFALLFSLPLLLRSPEFFGTANFSIAEFLFLTMILAWLIRKIKNKNYKLIHTDLNKYFYLFLIFTSISFIPLILNFAIGSGSHYLGSDLYSVKLLVNTFELFLAFLFVCENIDKPDIPKVFWILLSSLSITSIIAVIQHFFGLTFYQIFKIACASRQCSTLNDPNLFGSYLILILPFTLFYILRKNNKEKILLTIVSLLGIVSLLLSGSRGAFYALFGGILVTGLFYLKKKKKYLLFIVIFVILISSLFFIPYLNLDRLVKTSGKNIQSRIYTYKSTLNQIKEKPFLGIGPGSFYRKNVSSVNRETKYHAHNLYLQIFVERGIFAFLAFLGILVVFYKKFFNNKNKYFFLIPSFCGITSVLLHGLVDYPFFSQRVALLFFILLGISYKIMER